MNGLLTDERTERGGGWGWMGVGAEDGKKKNTEGF